MKKIFAILATVVFLTTVGIVNVYAKEVTLLMDWFPQGN